MIRTTPAKVEKILTADYDFECQTDLNPFIETASAMVDDIAQCAEDMGKPLTEERLELIERWLSAHFYGITDQPLTSESTLSSSASYQGETGMYLEATKYGQMAVMLDRSGCLQDMTQVAEESVPEITVDMVWLGKESSNQIPYDDRD